MEALLITTQQLEELLNVSHRTAVKIGEQAEAKIQIGRSVRWDLDSIKAYIKQIKK